MVTRVLFVCHGSICRSPMCEYAMKDMVQKRGIADRFEIASAATSREEIGNPVYPPARQKLAEHGISCSGHHARQMTKADYDHYDMIIAMDHNNIRNIYRITGGDPDGKISLLLAIQTERGMKSRIRGTPATSMRPGVMLRRASMACLKG